MLNKLLLPQDNLTQKQLFSLFGVQALNWTQLNQLLIVSKKSATSQIIECFYNNPIRHYIVLYRNREKGLTGLKYSCLDPLGTIEELPYLLTNYLYKQLRENFGLEITEDYKK